MQLVAYAMLLKAYLRDEKVTEEECGTRMDWQYIRRLNGSECPPLQCLKTLASTCRDCTPPDGKLAAAIFDEVSEQIRVINHKLGDCRLIKSTPMTKGYVTTLRSFLILWLGTLPFAVIGKFDWLATPVVATISYLFLRYRAYSLPYHPPLVPLSPSHGLCTARYSSSTRWLPTPVIARSVEKMAVEIEQPFGDDANDLPQEQYIMELEEVSCTSYAHDSL